MYNLIKDNEAILLRKMNALNAKDEFVATFTRAVANEMDLQDISIEEIYGDLFFKTCSEEMLSFYESEAGIQPEQGQSIEERRGILESKWKSAGHADVDMIKALAASWGRTIEVRLETSGTIIIRFTDEFGDPTGTEGFLKAVGEAIPCHLGYKTIPRYVTVRELQSMTIKEIEQLTINNFEWKEANHESVGV